MVEDKPRNLENEINLIEGIGIVISAVGMFLLCFCFLGPFVVKGMVLNDSVLSYISGLILLIVGVFLIAENDHRKGDVNET